MNLTAFWVTWFVLSVLIQLHSNHKMNKRINSNHKMHELNMTIKGDK